jgi:(S)-mandelate dehydrogenase
MRELEEWRRRAKRRLPRFVFDYIEGGAGDESVLARNRAAIQRIALIPRLLRDVTRCDLKTSLFGATFDCPMVVAPLGLSGLLWSGGDLCMARAAARANIPFVLSTASTSSIAEVAVAADGEKWFQLYMFEDRKIASRLLREAGAAGFRVLFITADVPVNGNRLRDKRNGFTVPLRLTPAALLEALMHPRWLSQALLPRRPTLANLDGEQGESGVAARAALAQRMMDRSLTWNSLDWIKAHWNGPIVLKGVLSSKDAARACDCGMSGIVVSNHGGRQFCAAPASMEVLSKIVDTVGGRTTVMVDSGFRTGVDVLKAVALGAKAVLVGRPLLYGLAAAGEPGVLSVLQSMRADMERALALLGCGRLDDLTAENAMRHA